MFRSPAVRIACPTCALIRTCICICILLGLLSAQTGCSDRSAIANDAQVDARDDGRAQDTVAGEGATPDQGLDRSIPDPDVAAADAQHRFSCDPREAICFMEPGPCPPGRVHSVVAGCWGPCVPYGECEPLQCDPTLVTCKMLPPDCAGESEVASVSGSCWGACVPIEICACDAGGPATQCPLDGFLCHGYAGRCGPPV